VKKAITHLKLDQANPGKLENSPAGQICIFARAGNIHQAFRSLAALRLAASLWDLTILVQQCS